MTLSPSPAPTAVARTRRLEQRLVAFQKLVEVEQRALALLALLPAGADHSQLLGLCRACEVSVRGKAPTVALIHAFIEGWLSVGLVAARGSGLSLDPDLQVFLVRLLADTPFGEQLRPSSLDAVFRIVPWHQESSYDLFQARVLRLTGAREEAGALLAKSIPSNHANFEYLYWFGPADPWSIPKHLPGWRELWTPRLHSALQSRHDVSWELCLLSANYRALGSVDELFLPIDRPKLPELGPELGAAGFDRSGWFSDILAQYRLFRGEHQAALAEVRGNPTLLEAHRGAFTLAGGDVAASLEHFTQAGGHNTGASAELWLGTWLGAFYAAALLAHRSPDSTQRVESLLRKMVGKGARRDTSDVPLALESLAKVHARVTGSGLGNLRESNTSYPSLMELLFVLLGEAWTDQIPARLGYAPRDLTALLTKLRELGYTWLTDELEACTRTPLSSAATTPLTSLIRPPEPWEAALDTLCRLSKTATPKPRSSAPPPAANRIAWFVRYYGTLLVPEPRLQLAKSGGFTKGRPIALQRFVTAARGESGTTCIAGGLMKAPGGGLRDLKGATRPTCVAKGTQAPQAVVAPVAFPLPLVHECMLGLSPRPTRQC